LLGIWRGASFADVNQQTGFDEPGKGTPHGDGGRRAQTNVTLVKTGGKFMLF